MNAFKWLAAVAILVVSSAVFAAHSNDIIVSHYEPLQRLSIRLADIDGNYSIQKSQRAAPVALSFDALGRVFDLQLESNDRLLSGMTRNALTDGIDIYRGQLANRPGSWARIVVFEGVPRGLIWDGEEMFAIEAPGDSLLQTTVPVIYRLADALIVPGTMSCGGAPMFASGSGAYNKLAGELSEVRAQGPGAVSEITMGAIGDFEFTSAMGGDADAVAAITTRLNNVDGIFSQQVGIQINVQTIETFSDPAADPFTNTGDSSALLDELSTYRSITPAQNNQGLTHLYTGRILDTTTVGVAWRGALCRNYYGAGLSEGRVGPTFDSLVAAHEIGHNFNAEHDGQAGSSCESEPETFIMAPSINMIEQFSACSIAVMEAEAAAAACITRLPTVDMAIALDAQSTTVLLGASTVLTYDVVNNGTLDATNVVVDITLPSNLSLQSVAVSSGTCFSGAGTANCSLESVPGISSRTIDIAVTPVSVGVGTLTAVVTSDVDERSSNNLEALQITVDPAVDLIVNTPVAASTLLGETTSISAVLENGSILEATGVTLTVSLSGGLRADSATWSIGSCTVTAQQIDCQATSFAAQSTSMLNVGVTGTSTGSKNYTVALSSDEADADPANNSVNSTVKITSPKDEGGGVTGPLFLYLLLMIALLARSRPTMRQCS
ncbi:MAG: DUF11 domain-containing protein [Proteobacteria bacterium]|nr:DUF11 domain-containing protein [Pseudomonadota bacterium]